MNKFTKGSVAAGAGLILLLGGAGTFMSWNGQEAIAAGPVTAGHLRLIPSEIEAWTVNGETVDIAGFRIVPGDTVVYSTALDLEAEGDNLTADLSLTDDSIIVGANGTAADQALVDELVQTAQLDLIENNSQITRVDEDSYLINAGTEAGPINEQVTVEVTLQFPFPEDGSDDEAAMGGAVSLEGMNVKLTQRLNPIAPVAE